VPVSFEGFKAGEGLEGDEGACLLGVMVPVVPDDSCLLPGGFDELLDLGPGNFNGVELDFKDGDYFNMGHKICLDYMRQRQAELKVDVV